MTTQPKTRMCLFVNDCAYDMAKAYTALMPGSEITEEVRIGDAPPFLVTFTLGGTPYMAMDGNDHFEARADHSISVSTVDQAETDRLWDALVEGGQEGPCGWLQDRFGVHWQIVPEALSRLMSSGDAEASERVQTALRQMKKIDVAALEAAFDGRT